MQKTKFRLWIVKFFEFFVVILVSSVVDNAVYSRGKSKLHKTWIDSDSEQIMKST